MNRDKIVDYLDKQIHKHLVFDSVPENDDGWWEVKRDDICKIVDGLIPMIKEELNKNKKNG